MDRCIMMVGMNHFTSSQVEISNVHQNGDRSPVCTFRNFHLERTCKYIWPCSILIWDQNQLHRSSIPEWLLVGYHWYQKGWWFFKIGLFLSSLSHESSSSLFTFLAYSCFGIILSSIASFIFSLLLISLYMR